MRNAKRFRGSQASQKLEGGRNCDRVLLSFHTIPLLIESSRAEEDVMWHRFLPRTSLFVESLWVKSHVAQKELGGT